MVQQHLCLTQYVVLVRDLEAGQLVLPLYPGRVGVAENQVSPYRFALSLLLASPHHLKGPSLTNSAIICI